LFIKDSLAHRHLRKDSLIVSGHCKKANNALEDVALVAVTSQNLSNLYSLDICGLAPLEILIFFGLPSL
jgi:hypothetical protein